MKGANDLHAAVIGLGSIGNRHVRNLSNRGVGQITIVRRRESNAEFDPPESCRVVHDLQEAIDLSPDFAIICTPSTHHVASAGKLIEVGIPCLIEKPLHGQLDDDVRRLARLAADSDAGKMSAMAYCMRYHAAYAMAAEQLSQHRIGRVLYAKAWFEGYLPDWHPWEDHTQSYAARIDQGGGVLRTLDHEIDFLNWTLGPARRSCGMANNAAAIDIEADEVAHIVSIHGQGATSQTTLSFCRKPASRGFQFVGTEGTLSFDFAGGHLSVENHDNESTSLLRCDNNNVAEMYVNLLDEYIDSLIGEDPRPGRLAAIEAGIQSLAVIDAVENVHR